MLAATDTFVQYMSDNVSALPVYWWRKGDAQNHSGFLKQDAVNIQFMGFWGRGSTEDCLVSIDVLASDERTMLAALEDVRNVLVQEQVVPERDFTDPDNPAFTGRAISWDGRRIRFLSIRTPAGARYAHYNATFPVTHTRE